MASKWKSIATGVAVAAVGATAFGALHYMFLGTYLGTQPAVMGIEMHTIAAIALGAAGFAVAAYKPNILGKWTKVLEYGGAASIGYGIARYAGWVAKGTGTYTTWSAPPTAYRPSLPITPRASAMTNNVGGFKVI